MIALTKIDIFINTDFLSPIYFVLLSLARPMTLQLCKCIATAGGLSAISNRKITFEVCIHLCAETFTNCDYDKYYELCQKHSWTSILKYTQIKSVITVMLLQHVWLNEVG